MRARGMGPFGLARGASFNKIDRAVIEMRTKLTRDNARPLISAAAEERAAMRAREGGSSAPRRTTNLSVSVSSASA